MEVIRTGKKRVQAETGGKWYQQGYQNGFRFAREEADYEELAAIVRAQQIPAMWDIFRAEILNRFIGTPDFDFQKYEHGFVSACKAFFEKI